MVVTECANQLENSMMLRTNQQEIPTDVAGRCNLNFSHKASESKTSVADSRRSIDDFVEANNQTCIMEITMHFHHQQKLIEKLLSKEIQPDDKTYKNYCRINSKAICYKLQMPELCLDARVI